MEEPIQRKRIRVPLELKSLFLRNPENFIRDLACVSTESVRPFFKRQIEITKVEVGAYKNPFDDKLLEFDEDFHPKPGDNHRRFMHIDLALKKDAVGISMCHSPKFVEREIVEFDKNQMVKAVVRVPFIKFDFLGRIGSTRGEEILLSQIREVVYEISRRKFYIALLTYDGFQSVDSIQILRSQGYKVARLSVDRAATKVLLDKKAPDGTGIIRKSTEGQILGPMQALKDVLYDSRLAIPYHEYWKIEAKGAEIDYRKNKVDHKPRGSIDLLQSMAGGAYNLINNEFEYIEESLEAQQETEDDFYDGLGSRDDDFYEEGPGEELTREDVW